ncbi:hypothetical protein [Brevundimonas lenta]|uniref:Uncharacterized protein n=1 Tax=Brevundimonas lenta TaxID=424796 RepID=A0A7W6JDB9_9CAUL|nr:hypothetical protein [Brevundimonas lenta]MBB4082051.1 hypothetical protein [Brevundimonas lenta]
MSPSILDKFLDWNSPTRDMLVFAGAGIVALIAALWLFGSDSSSPIRATEAAVREALDDPDVRISGTRLEYTSGYRQRLVCGRVADDPNRPFAALVRESEDQSPLSLIGSGDRVQRLALPEVRSPTPEQAELLAACARKG